MQYLLPMERSAANLLATVAAVDQWDRQMDTQPTQNFLQSLRFDGQLDMKNKNWKICISKMLKRMLVKFKKNISMWFKKRK